MVKGAIKHATDHSNSYTDSGIDKIIAFFTTLVIEAANTKVSISATLFMRKISSRFAILLSNTNRAH